MSDLPIPDDPLLGLFHEDVHNYVGQLVEKLATLAVDPNHPVDWDSLETVARGIRASALIVEQQQSVNLAQGLADIFANVKTGGLKLKSSHVSDLLSVVTCLRDTADAVITPDAKLPDPSAPQKLLTTLLGASVAPTPPAAPPKADTDPDPPITVTVQPPKPPKPVPVAPPPTPPPAPSNPRTATPAFHLDEDLLRLFRDEVEKYCLTLDDGLVELESAPNDTRIIEPLMRAAHSLKGAVRIVECTPAIDLAHVMEELFVATQRGKYAITTSDIDVLLKATDLLAKLKTADIPGWIEANTDSSKSLAEQINARLQGKSAPKPTPNLLTSAEPAVAPTPPTVEVTLSRRVENPPTVAQEETKPAAKPVVEEETKPAAKPDEPAKDQKDQIVRISAQSLTRLLSLAGESLVEARWLQPFSTSLLKLRKHLDHLADVVDDVCRGMENLPLGNRTRDSAFDARERLLTSRGALAERIEEFENHARRSDDLNSRLYREVILSRMRPFSDVTLGW